MNNCRKYLIKGSKVLSKSINLHTVESNIAKEVGKIQKIFSRKVDIGSYPFFRLGKIGVSIVLRSEKQSKIDNCKSQILKFVNGKNIEVVDR